MYKLSIFYKKGVKLYRPTEEEVKRRQEEYKRIRLEEIAEKILEVPHKKREDGKYDVYGSVNLYNMQLTSLLELPIRFGKVYGDFLCRYNQLRDLKSAPEYVGKSFSCSNNRLVSLEGAPKYVDGNFYCNYNQLESLKSAPEYVGGSFWCNNNQLRDLEGAPAYVDGDFYCSFNQLANLEGAPKYVSRDFVCSRNRLVSLEGAPKYVGGGFFIHNNAKKFTEEEVRKVVEVKGEVHI